MVYLWPDFIKFPGFLRRRQHEIPSGYVKIAIANGPFIVDFPIKNGMEIFHSYCM